MHWAMKYIGQKWEHEKDCFYWFRTIRKEQFNHDVPICGVDHTNLVLSASRILTGDVKGVFGYKQVDSPGEGDAVFMTQRNTPHHVGMIIFPGGKMMVLHALEGIGVIVSDLMDLKMNGWKIVGYWSSEN